MILKIGVGIAPRSETRLVVSWNMQTCISYLLIIMKNSLVIWQCMMTFQQRLGNYYVSHLIACLCYWLVLSYGAPATSAVAALLTE